MRKNIQRTIARSNRGRCAVCNKQCLLVLHHIAGRKIPNWNKPWNEVWLCSDCHFELHSQFPNRIVIEEWISTTNGRELVWHRREEPSQNTQKS